MKQTIAVDLDDVVSSQTDALIRYSNGQFGTSLTPDDFMEPGEYWGYYEQIWNVGPEEGAKRFQQFLDDNGPLTQLVTPETLEAIRTLRQQYRLEVITSRGADYQDVTREWLEQHIPDVFDGLHFVELWNRPDRKATKAHICKEIGAGYLIDDNVDHCALAAEAGVSALLFGDYGWSRGKDIPQGISRVADWPAVLEYFDARQA